MKGIKEKHPLLCEFIYFVEQFFFSIVRWLELSVLVIAKSAPESEQFHLTRGRKSSCLNLSNVILYPRSRKCPWKFPFDFGRDRL
jgi:hypothetical protein